jgi:hypothetical protein
MAPMAQHRYHAFVDPSGGSADSFTMSISHKESDRVVIDLAREVKPPFDPSTVVDDFCIALKQYRINRVTGDRYAGEWPREQFRKRGIGYICSDKVKSDLFRDLLPLLNSGRIVLPKSERLVSQLTGLERRVARSGKDSIDHGPGTHDDLANVVAGAANLIALADRAMNTGRVATYGYVVPDEEVETSGTPDTADHSKPYRGYFDHRYNELRQKWKGNGSDRGHNEKLNDNKEKLIAELRELRATTGELNYHKMINELISEIKGQEVQSGG